MNSKERVRAAARREKTDRPPTSLRCTAEAWESIRRHLGVGTNDDVLDALDIDVRWIGLPFIGPAERSAAPLFSEGTDFWGCHTRKVVNPFNTYFEFDFHPLANAECVRDVENHDWPCLDWWDYDAVCAQLQVANRAEPRSCLFFAGGAFETPWYLRGMEQFLMDLYARPDIVESICSHVERYYRERALRVIEATGDGIDIIGSGGDVGGQQGMMLAPEVWREQIKPFTGRLISTFKKLGFITFYHSCGSIVPIIDDLIEVGLDILDPIQVNAAGMEPEALGPAFAERLTFHGAIDEVALLPHATPKKVYEETQRVIGILGRRGGYIVSPSHQVQGDTPPENIVALFEAARDFRW